MRYSRPAMLVPLFMLVAAALLAGCGTPPVFPPTAVPSALAPSGTDAPASPAPSDTAAPPTPTAIVEPAATSTLVPTAAPPLPSPAATTRTTGAAPQDSRSATAAPVAVATVARATSAPVLVATPEASGLGSTQVITPTAAGSTTYRVAQLTLPTYPYASYLSPASDPEVSGYPALSLKRSAYEAANPRPAPQTYRLLVVENRYLRLGILPDLGGRIIECVYKPTGANEFYANPVIKPTEWGPAAPPNVPGANWWLASGGLEWGFPVEEHGYEFGTVWGFDHVSQPDGGVMITVFTRNGPEAPYAVVDIILPPDTAYFVIQPRVVNPLGAPFRFKWWSNAMLAPGQPNTVTPELRFILPATELTVHSTGDPTLPAPGQPLPWPIAAGRDLSRLGNWTSYLGAFSRPAAQAGYAAVYDPSLDEGMVRIYPPSVAKGQKIFAPRGSAGLDPALWTDDGSTYVELHGGLQPTFADWYELGPGDDVTWSEFWYPVAGIGGITYANDRAALSLLPVAGKLRVGLFPTAAVDGQLTVTVQGGSPVTLPARIAPERPFLVDLVLPDAVPPQGEAAVTVVDASGATLLEWKGYVQLR